MYSSMVYMYISIDITNYILNFVNSIKYKFRYTKYYL